MNQSSDLNEFVEKAKNKFPPFSQLLLILLKFDQTKALMNRYLSHFKLTKWTKIFHYTEIVTTKFMEINFTWLLLSFFGKFYRVSYEFL